MPASALEQVLALAAQQDGVVSRAQWQGLGLHHNSVARLVGTGQWLALAPGLHQVHPGPVQAQALGWAVFCWAVSNRLWQGWPQPTCWGWSR